MFHQLLYRLVISAFILCCMVYQVQGQDKIPGTFFHFEAKMIGHQDSLPVPFAHVFNESSKKSLITDTTGVFRVRVSPSDTLVINAVGYYPKVIFIADYTGSSALHVITMHQRMYEIAEVQVTALGNYRQFKQKVLELELPVTREEQLRGDLSDFAYQAAKDIKRQPSVAEQYNPIPDGIGVATLYTPYEKQLKNYRAFIKKDTRRKVIYAKYNKDLIRRITKLEEPELTRFYAWLEFKEEWLFQASEYEIGERIKQKYALYLAEKTDETLMHCCPQKEMKRTAN